MTNYKDILLLAHERAGASGYLCFELDRMYVRNEINTYTLVELKRAINNELARMRRKQLRADTLRDVLHVTGVLDKRDGMTPERYLPLRLEFIDRVLKSFDRVLLSGTIVP